MSFEIKGDIKKLSVKKGDVIVVRFKDARLFKSFMQMEHNPLADNIRKGLGAKTPILVLPPGIDLEVLTKEHLERLEND